MEPLSNILGWFCLGMEMSESEFEEKDSVYVCEHSICTESIKYMWCLICAQL